MGVVICMYVCLFRFLPVDCVEEIVNNSLADVTDLLDENDVIATDNLSQQRGWERR